MLSSIDQAFTGLLIALALLLGFAVAWVIDRGLSAARRMKHWTRREVGR